MRSNVRILVLALAALALVATPACNSKLDDGDGPDVVLETGTITVPAIQGQIDATSGVCTFTVTDATAQLVNKAKNSSVVTSSPFNDIRNLTLTVTYEWDSTLVSPTPVRVMAIPGTVPANGNATVGFAPIFLGDLTPDKEGHTANMWMVFQGETVEGSPISALGTGRTLSIGSCQ